MALTDGLRILGVLIAAAMWSCADDDVPPGRFPCGVHGGSCDIETEICVVGESDNCSTCIARPDTCAVRDECGCLDGVDKSAWPEAPCADDGSCEVRGDGLQVTCMPDGWGCG